MKGGTLCVRCQSVCAASLTIFLTKLSLKIFLVYLDDKIVNCIPRVTYIYLYTCIVSAEQMLAQQIYDTAYRLEVPFLCNLLRCNKKLQ